MPAPESHQPTICFDDDCRIRVLDAEKFTHTEELEHESNQFVTKIEEFSSIIRDVAEITEQQAKKIEFEKLRAIGQRHRVEGEVETRARRKHALQGMIKERTMEFERYVEEYDSLARVEAEQQALIERLSNNEA